MRRSMIWFFYYLEITVSWHIAIFQIFILSFPICAIILFFFSSASIRYRVCPVCAESSTRLPGQSTGILFQFKMRLLNVRTLKLREFPKADIPYYAILSHRWEDEEVSFQDLQTGKGSEMKGWGKIRGCCDQALKQNLYYVVSVSWRIYKFRN